MLSLVGKVLVVDLDAQADATVLLGLGGNYGDLIEEDAEISISFIHEGAGYKNVLGYYYYKFINKPKALGFDTENLIFAEHN